MIVSTGWKNLKTNSNNITLQEKKIYRVKVISMIPELVQQQVFLRGYKRKINLATNGKQHNLFPLQRAVLKQTFLALKKVTTIRNIAKVFGVSTRTVWKTKGITSFYPKVNIFKIASSITQWFNAYNDMRIDEIELGKIMKGEKPP